MLEARLLNSEASLNNFKELASVSYVPGEVVKVAFRLFDPQLEIRFVPLASSTVNITIIKTDGTNLVKAASLISADDRSMWTFTLSATESTEIAGSNIQVDLDNGGGGTDIRKTVIQNALIKQTISGDC